MSTPRTTVIIAEAQGNVTALGQARLDEDPTIRAASLGALARLGALTNADVLEGLGDQDAAVRCRAIELGIARSELDLIRMLDDADDLVVETAAWALGERGANDDATLARLSEVGRTHEVSICREAAVAALGAIGDNAGLPTILHAMTDRAPVRRRAVLALAPFDTDQVTMALRDALDDRDRQVRQAAEDLLGTES